MVSVFMESLKEDWQLREGQASDKPQQDLLVPLYIPPIPKYPGAHKLYISINLSIMLVPAISG